MYEAVGGLRHLLHGLTVVGVAAAHNANLENTYIALLNASVTREVALDEALRAQTSAQAKVGALKHQLLRKYSEAQARELALAKRELKRTRANVTECKAAIERSNALLALIRSDITAFRGALLRVCHPVV